MKKTIIFLLRREDSLRKQGQNQHCARRSLRSMTNHLCSLFAYRSPVFCLAHCLYSSPRGNVLRPGEIVRVCVMQLVCFSEFATRKNASAFIACRSPKDAYMHRLPSGLLASHPGAAQPCTFTRLMRCSTYALNAAASSASIASMPCLRSYSARSKANFGTFSNGSTIRDADPTRTP